MFLDRTRLPVILDIEASGFGRGSYPIEIGVASDSGDQFSWLVLPQDDWTHWSEEAADLHKITRQDIEDNGIHPRQIAKDLNEQFEGQILYSDGWGFDSGWLSLLFYVAQKPMLFKLDTLPKILTEYQLERWDETKAEIRRKNGWQHHRAAIDAKLLQMTFQQTFIDEHLK